METIFRATARPENRLAATEATYAGGMFPRPCRLRCRPGGRTISSMTSTPLHELFARSSMREPAERLDRTTSSRADRRVLQRPTLFVARCRGDGRSSFGSPDPLPGRHCVACSSRVLAPRWRRAGSARGLALADRPAHRGPCRMELGRHHDRHSWRIAATTKTTHRPGRSVGGGYTASVVPDSSDARCRRATVPESRCRLLEDRSMTRPRRSSSSRPQLCLRWQWARSRRRGGVAEWTISPDLPPSCSRSQFDPSSRC